MLITDTSYLCDSHYDLHELIADHTRSNVQHAYAVYRRIALPKAYEILIRKSYNSRFRLTVYRSVL